MKLYKCHLIDILKGRLVLVCKVDTCPTHSHNVMGLYIHSLRRMTTVSLMMLSYCDLFCFTLGHVEKNVHAVRFNVQYKWEKRIRNSKY